MFPETLSPFPYRRVLYFLNIILLIFIIIHYTTSFTSSQIKLLLFAYIIIVFYILFIDPLNVKTSEYPIYTNIEKGDNKYFLKNQVSTR